MKQSILSLLVSCGLTGVLWYAYTIVRDYSYFDAQTNQIVIYCIYGLIALLWLAFVATVVSAIWRWVHRGQAAAEPAATDADVADKKAKPSKADSTAKSRGDGKGKKGKRKQKEAAGTAAK